ncbi:hypothetical protein CMESO_415 (nucleomorph) [Chroomonas mesostigmatica CCMP1168]|uniref:Uncharacterized protein n=1 Tax=Chroomonas mesostigmatica CCMP1168 TaxID=1195612 RepID=J7G8G9_9CRYP|nr:hypothetical protein CMESO_415 [Chroomonas mesostigmatica CCMP1168]|mmetsp:Transcript_58821/g.144217  ORF Transcript_58821/g.144217 Transcript_58821/m.144217 type:complete len:158 (-) Transcript_58821:72-545(-)
MLVNSSFLKFKNNISFFSEKNSLKMNIYSEGEDLYKKKFENESKLYTFDSMFPGTAPPGLLKENIPLQEVLSLKINNLNVQEFSRDQQCGVIRGADESILDWLESRGKIKPRLNEDTKEDLSDKNQTLLEDEFDFEDVDDSLENLFGQPNLTLSDFV